MNKINLEFDKFPQIQNESFILSEVKKDDYSSLYEIYSDDETIKYQQIDTMKTIEQSQKSVQSFLQGFINRKFIRWCISRKEDDKVIGLITLHDFDNWNSKTEIGYMLNRKYWGQNIMSEVGREIIKFTFETIRLNRIEASIHPENIASIKLSEKLGFKKEGLKIEAAYNIRTKEYEDRLIFGITKNRRR